MAFSPSTLSIIVQPIGGVGIRFLSYITDDTLDAVVGVDYFAGTVRFGLRLGDLIFVIPQTPGAFDTYIVNVTDIDASGNATVLPVPGELAAGVYLTRDALVADVAGDMIPVTGKTYIAAGFFYIGAAGAIDIPDLPGLLPLGDIHVEHFGAKGNLTFTLGASGYVRTGGTDDRAAFVASNAYATAIGCGFIASGKYYVSGQLDITASFDGDNFRGYLWVYYTLLQQGIHISASNVFINEINVIGQYDRQGLPKPAGTGNLGAIIGAGAAFIGTPQVKTENIGGNVKVCRATNLTTTQPSSGAWMIFMMGRVENKHWKIGTHGKTNVTSNGLYIEHFGAWDLNPTNPPSTIGSDIQETYHPMGGTVEFTNEFDYSNDRFGHVWESASSGETYFGPSVSRGMGGPFTIGIGDYGDRYTTPTQAGRVNKGIRAGRQVAYDVTGQIDWANYGIYIKGRGESKHEYYAGTSIFLQTQSKYDIEIDSIYMTVAAGSIPATSPGKAIFVEGLWGRCDLGRVEVYGSQIALERESGTGDLIYNFAGGEGTLKHEFARGGRILGSRVMKGLTPGSGSGSDEEGYQTDNRCVSIIGAADEVTVLTANVAKGDTLYPITAFANDIYIDDPILMDGANTVHATSTIRDGVPFFEGTPAPVAMLAGTSVALSRRAVVDEFIGDYESSEDGTVANNATIYNADLSGVRFTGQSAAKLGANTQMFLTGSMPRAVGLITPITNNYTIRLESNSRLFARDMRIMTNPSVTAHLWCEDSSANAVFTNCYIQSSAALFDSAMTYDQGLLVGCMNFSGAFITRHTLGGQSAQPASGSVTLNTRINYPYFQMTFTFASARVTVTDAGGSGSSGSLQLFDFEQGAIQMLGSRHSWSAFAEGGALTGGANDAAFVIGFGSVAANAGDGALTGAEIDFGNTASITLPATGLNSSAVTGVQTPLDGTATAKDLYLNWSGTAATIDANSTIDVTGTYTLNGMFIGDD